MHEGTIFPWGTESIKSEKGKYKGVILANYNRSSGDFMGFAGSLNDGGDVTCRVGNYWANNFGIYHMAGNVAEMVAEKSICKGGSWFKGSHKMVISARDTFEVAESRCRFYSKRFMLYTVRWNIKLWFWKNYQ